MASELCMNCFSVKGKYEVCPFCGYAEGTPPGQPHYLMPGTILANRFILGTAIGSGGFGITYRCLDTALGVVAAVKEFYPAGLVKRAPGESHVSILPGAGREQHRGQRNRFLMEAESIAGFGKAGDIVNVYDIIEANNTAYIIMEYVDSILLKDYLEKQGRMDMNMAMSVIISIIEAVKKIHARGLIHRDISPDNIFISGEDSIKIFDFGAALLDGSSGRGTGEQIIKAGYSAPEQYREKSKQGFYTDVYSVGAIMYQMVTGIRPMESVEREFCDELRSPAELGVKLEPNVDRAIMEAMAVRPELRFQSIRQFEDALRSNRIAEYPEEKQKKRKRRRNWIISFTAALILTAVVIAGLFSMVFGPENKIFDSTLAEDTITVWVENEDQRTRLERIVDNNFKASTNTESCSEQIVRMLENNKKITVQVVNITEKDTGATMDDRLKQAKEEGNMPDMFLTDHVSNLDEYDLVSMKENVYDAMESEDYLYMSVYPQYFPEMKEMPAGINTILFYAFRLNENNSFGDSTFADASAESVELEELLAANDGDERTEFTVFEDLCYTKASQRGSKDKAGGSAGITGNSVVAGVEYRSRMQELRRGNTARDRSDPDTLADYSVSVVTSGGRMLVSYGDKYAISADSTENRQIACMRLIWIMLGEAAQAENYAADGTTLFPINSASFDEFFTYNSQYECFRNMVRNNNPCILVGKGSVDIGSFSKKGD